MSEEGGEGYFASVSDLMVGILFVFLLMLTVFALNFRDAEDATFEKVPKAELDAARAEIAQLAETLKVEQSRTAAAVSRALDAERDASEARAALERERVLQQEQAARIGRLIAHNDTLRSLLEQASARIKREEELAARAELLAKIKGRLDKEDLKVVVDPSSTVLRVSDQILFKIGADTLDSKAVTAVKSIANALGEHLPCYAAQAPVSCPGGLRPVIETVLVEGHTDEQRWKPELKRISTPQSASEGVERPTIVTTVARARGAEESKELNDELSAKRSAAVFKELLRSNAGLDQIRNADNQPLLGVSAYGQRRPIPKEAGMAEEAYHARNRRIDLRFVLSSQPTGDLDDLQRRIEAVLAAETP